MTKEEKEALGNKSGSLPIHGKICTDFHSSSQKEWDVQEDAQLIRCREDESEPKITWTARFKHAANAINAPTRPEVSITHVNGTEPEFATTNTSKKDSQTAPSATWPKP